MQPISRRRHTDDLKARAITLAQYVGPAAARQLGMSVKTLANWLDVSRAGQPLRSAAR